MNYFEKTGTPQYSGFIAKSKYARWLEDKKRRETWLESTQRYIDFWVGRFPELEEEIQVFHSNLLNFESMPSMRALMTAGKALDKDEVSGYNCSYVAIDNVKAFDEILYILTCGTGVGFSVERQYINKLPEVAEEFFESDTVIVVPDSKKGWASSFRELVSLLYSGKIPKWDMSRVRPRGARLKTFGGRASGPEPLESLFKFSVQLFKKAAGRRLNSIECHDLVCKVADIVVSGGVRRSALLSLSNLSDDRMRAAKNGQWWVENPQRRLSNNSACYTERPEFGVFMDEWRSLYESKSGERGIFSRVAAQKKAASLAGYCPLRPDRDPNHEFGVNPCSEIILRSMQFCNLSEIVVRAGDTLEDLMRKAVAAAVFGTLQSTLTNFKYLRKAWQNNTKEERLLGVSLTGVMDHEILSVPGSQAEEWLAKIKRVVVQTNIEWAQKLGINPSVATTCVKPSGTVSQLVNSASGLHARFSPFYLRRVRILTDDPLCKMMIDKGFPGEQDKFNPRNWVFSFPIRSPESSMTVEKQSVEHQLETWKMLQDHWCEHKPSCTIYYTDDSFLRVGDWVWKHFDEISGISFLPYSDHIYEQAPYHPISEEEYHAAVEKMPAEVDWGALGDYELEDATTSSRELQCSGGLCEVVDIVEES